jgi:hypothetical protein
MDDDQHGSKENKEREKRREGIDDGGKVGVGGGVEAGARVASESGVATLPRCHPRRPVGPSHGQK